MCYLPMFMPFLTFMYWISLKIAIHISSMPRLISTFRELCMFGESTFSRSYPTLTSSPIWQVQSKYCYNSQSRLLYNLCDDSASTRIRKLCWVLVDGPYVMVPHIGSSTVFHKTLAITAAPYLVLLEPGNAPFFSAWQPGWQLRTLLWCFVPSHAFNTKG